MNFSATLFLALLLLNFASVKAQGVQDPAALNFDSLMNKISANQPSYKTLSARARMIWKDGENEQDFQAGIRVKKDSLVWMSLGLMGIEGIRLLFSPDSFYFINKLTNEYAIRDLRYLQNWLLFPIGYRGLEEIITGSALSINPKATMALREDSSYMLYLESDQILEKIKVNTQNYTIENILLKDKLLKQDLTITFDGYNSLPEARHDTLPRQTDGAANLFPYKRNIVIHRETGTVILNMELYKLSFDGDLTFPFEVNEKYKRIE